MLNAFQYLKWLVFAGGVLFSGVTRRAPGALPGVWAPGLSLVGFSAPARGHLGMFTEQLTCTSQCTHCAASPSRRGGGCYQESLLRAFGAHWMWRRLPGRSQGPAGWFFWLQVIFLLLSHTKFPCKQWLNPQLHPRQRIFCKCAHCQIWQLPTTEILAQMKISSNVPLGKLCAFDK